MAGHRSTIIAVILFSSLSTRASIFKSFISNFFKFVNSFKRFTKESCTKPIPPIRNSFRLGKSSPKEETSNTCSGRPISYNVRLFRLLALPRAAKVGSVSLLQRKIHTLSNRSQLLTAASMNSFDTEQEIISSFFKPAGKRVLFQDEA